MNNKIKISALLLTSLFGLFAVATPASALTCNSATITGTVVTGTPPTHARFEYATNYNTVANGGGTPTTVQYFNTEGTFPIQQFLSGLTENTTYYYRLVVTNNYGTQNLNIRNFTTPACNPNPPQNPTVNIDASPRTINYGGSSVLTWTSTNATYCSASGGANNWEGQKTTQGSSGTGTLFYTTTFNITCYGASGTTPASDSVTVTVQSQQQPPTVNISANPPSVSMNGTSVITWNSNNATSCTGTGGVNGWSGGKGTSGSFYTGQLTSTTNFGITCTNSGGQSANASTTVTVTQAQTCQDPNANNYGGPLPCTYNQPQPPTVSLYANPTQVNQNGSSVLTWTSNNATSCSASGGVSGWPGNKPISGTFYTGALTNTVTFYITCTNSIGQQANASAIVFVDNNNGGGNVSVNIYADDTSIDEGDETMVRWDSNNADYCTASGGTNGWSGSRNTSGSFDTGSLDNDETYRITCYNQNGSATDYVTINVDEDNNNNNNDDEPDVTTRNATNVSTSSATLNGRVDGNGSSVRAWFEYGTNTNLGYTTSQNSYGSGSTDYSRSISGLYPNTTYYFRAVAENSDGTDYGSILSFRTGENFIYNPPVNNQPTVVIFADSTNLSYNGATTIRWSTYNASSCVASGGSVGWAGVKSLGPASFYTGSLTSSRTYTITCTNNYGSATDYVTVNVRGQVINNPVTPTSYVIINSSVDRNQPIVPTIDNTRPRPGDEINYTVSYQNIGNASITSLTLRLDLPYEVDYMFSTPNNPTRNGNTLIFNLGTLRANGQGSVTVRVRVRENVAPGALLNFPAILTYTDPAGNTQSVSANVSAQVWNGDDTKNNIFLGANVFGADFLPDNLFGWLILLILILILILLARYLYSGVQPFKKRTVTTTVQH